MRARPTRPWKGQCGSICLWIFHNFCFLKVSEKYPLWREIFGGSPGPWRWTFWIFPAMFQALTEKQKDSQDSQATLCFSVKAWYTAKKVQKVHLHGPKKISRQRGYFSETFRKQKSWKIQRQIDPHWPFHGLVGLALTKSKKHFGNFLKILGK